MKTRDRILKVALELFNQEGEAEVSTVEIAAVLDISPGNLYYHFKGKDAIIEALYGNFEEEIQQVLRAPIAEPLGLEDNWIYVYIVFEEIHDFRFFYNALPTILERCPQLRPRFRRLLALKLRVIETLLGAVRDMTFLSVSDSELNLLAERLTLQITYWVQYCSLRRPEAEPAELIHEGVYSVLAQLTPHLGDNASAYAQLLREFYEKTKR